MHNGFVKIIVILCAFTLAITQLPAGETLWVGVDVPEPKLIHKVQIAYPPPDVVFVYPYVGPAVLDIIISEQGAVTEVAGRYFESVDRQDKRNFFYPLG